MAATEDSTTQPRKQRLSTPQVFDGTVRLKYLAYKSINMGKELVIEKRWTGRQGASGTGPEVWRAERQGVCVSRAFGRHGQGERGDEQGRATYLPEPPDIAGHPARNSPVLTWSAPALPSQMVNSGELRVWAGIIR
jgi:hypothetical protein